MEKIKNLSLRKTIVLYMIVSLIVSFYLSALIMRMAATIQDNIWWKYVDQEKYFEMAEGDGRKYLTDVPRPNSYEMKKFGKRCELECVETAEKFSGDKEVILEVIENLLSNAFRYAKTKVEMEVLLTCSELEIRVKDDGVGFTVDKQKATELFYQQNVKDSLKHSGMGMYISRLYCEKHGGQLLIENEKQSGAVITAVFHRIA